MEFTDQVVLVTGAARGIGAATARAFAQAGADVVVNDILDAQPIADEIAGLGRRSMFLQADVADAEQVDSMVQAAFDKMGKIDVLVANAAFSDRAPFHEISLEGFRRTIDVTMYGPFYCMRSVVKRMLAAETTGAIVVVGSPHAVAPVADSMAYNMAKAAVDHMVRTAAVELYDKPIRVNCVHPGWTDTPGERKFTSDEEITRQLHRLPRNRLARPEEIARGILFLASRDSDYISGSTLAIDGALRMAAAGKGV